VTPVYIVLSVMGSLFVVLFVVGFARTPADPLRALKERFITLSRLSKLQAEAELLDRVEALSQRFPGKSYGWYLEWLVTDLERAKR
jgi:hypothetical protein